MGKALANLLDRAELVAHRLKDTFARVGSLLLAASDFIEPDRGSPEISLSYIYVLLGLGFLLGTIGHIAKARWLVIVGIVMIMTASVGLPFVVGSGR